MNHEMLSVSYLMTADGRTFSPGDRSDLSVCNRVSSADNDDDDDDYDDD